MQSYYSEVISILSRARRMGITIFLDDDKLKFKIEKSKTYDPVFVEEIKSRKEAIIHFLKSDEGNVSRINAFRKKICPFDRDAVRKPPLSFAQQRLWFIDQLQGSIQYHLPAVFRLTGKLDKSALEQAFRWIVRRHEVLRTVVWQEDGQPYQHVADWTNWQLTCHEETIGSDLEALTPVVEGIIQEPFDLSQDPMLRVVLLQISEEEHLLVVVLHHIAADGLSVPILVGELLDVYEAVQEQRPVQLAALPVQYADYALWQ